MHILGQDRDTTVFLQKEQGRAEDGWTHGSATEWELGLIVYRRCAQSKVLHLTIVLFILNNNRKLASYHRQTKQLQALPSSGTEHSVTILMLYLKLFLPQCVRT